MVVLEHNIRRGLVETDAEAVQLLLNNELVGHGLEGVQHNQQHIAGEGS